MDAAQPAAVPPILDAAEDRLTIWAKGRYGLSSVSRPAKRLFYRAVMAHPTRALALSTALFAVLFLLFVLLMARAWVG
jgi:hypothetical protein